MARQHNVTQYLVSLAHATAYAYSLLHYTSQSHLQRPPTGTDPSHHFKRKINQAFFWRRHGPKIPLRIHQNTPFQVKNHFFQGRGLSVPDPSLSGEVPPHPTPPPRQTFGIRPYDLHICIAPFVVTSEA